MKKNIYIYSIYTILVTILTIVLLIHGDYLNRVRSRFGFETNYDYRVNKIYFQRLAAMEYFQNDSSFDTVMVGDSIIDYFEWTQVFTRQNVLNFGIAGDTSEGVLKRLDFVFRLKPKRVLLSVGTNDITHNIPNKQIEDNIKKIIEKLRNEDINIYIVSILPTASKEKNNKIEIVNSSIEKFCIDNGICFIDAYKLFLSEEGAINSELTLEGLHLNANGYKLLIDCIGTFINK